MYAVELKNVSKRFGALRVIERVSLRVEPGRVVGIAGPSGSGKTTLLRLIAGLERPDAGAIRLHGTAVSSDGIFVPPVARNVAMVFQDFALWPHLHVEGHLDFVLRARHVPRRERHTRTAALLDLCQLEDKRHAYPKELSGGQQQRVAIARALAMHSPVVLLDEPFSNLDAELRSRIASELTRLKNDEHTTFLLAGHDLEISELAPDEVITLSAFERGI
jgi:iron(III) transport system ATP-binding protein